MSTSISAFRYPAKIALVDNQVNFGFKATGQVVSGGTKAKLGIMFVTMPVNLPGVQFKLTFAGRDITFTSAYATDDSGEQWRCATSSMANWDTFTKNVADDINANYYISSLYDVTFIAGIVILTAKNVGSDYNITANNISVPDLVFGGNAGVNEVDNPFFKVYIQIVIGNKIYERFRSVNNGNQAFFDISGLLRPEVKAGFTFPETVNNLMILRNEARVSYYVRYGLFYGMIPKVKKLTNTAVMYALSGGVNSMTELRYNELNTSFYEQLMVNHQFLTWHPNGKRTQPGYIEKLWYIVHTELTKLKLKVRLNFDNNGSAYTHIVTKSIKSANLYDVFEICCGYNLLQLSIDIGYIHSNYIFLSYDVFLTNENDTLISPMWNYYIDEEITLFDRQFIFTNSFNMAETFTARQIKQTEPQYERIQINKIREINFKSVADRRNYMNSESNKQIVEIGNFISLEEKRYLSELLLSTEVYEIVNGMKYPVVITGTNKTPEVDDQFLNNVAIEYVYAYTDQHYSREESVVAIGGVGPLPTVKVSAPVSGATPGHAGQVVPVAGPGTHSTGGGTWGTGG